MGTKTKDIDPISFVCNSIVSDIKERISQGDRYMSMEDFIDIVESSKSYARLEFGGTTKYIQVEDFCLLDFQDEEHTTISRDIQMSIFDLGED
jgi:hypothetical protein